MNVTEAKQYLISKKLFQKPKISKLGRGNNYDVFLVEESNQKYTLRASRTDVITENRLQNEFEILQFLAYSKIDFAQKPIYLDKKNKIALLTFAPGKEIDITKLNGKKLEKFVEQLVKLHSLKYNDYLKFCRNNKIEAKKPETPLENLQIKGISRFDYVLKNCEDKKLINWIAPKLEEAKKSAKNQKCGKNNLIFNHCDLGGANIILDGEKICFIDWEQAKFVYHSDFWLGHIFIRCRHSSSIKQQKITELYAKKTNQNPKELQNKIKERMRISKLTDLIWAAKMYTELKNNGFKNWPHYQKMTKQIIAEYDKMFND